MCVCVYVAHIQCVPLVHAYLHIYTCAYICKYTYSSNIMYVQCSAFLFLKAQFSMLSWCSFFVLYVAKAPI